MKEKLEMVLLLIGIAALILALKGVNVAATEYEKQARGNHEITSLHN